MDSQITNLNNQLPTSRIKSLKSSRNWLAKKKKLSKIALLKKNHLVSRTKKIWKKLKNLTCLGQKGRKLNLKSESR